MAVSFVKTKWIEDCFKGFDKNDVMTSFVIINGF